MKGRYSDPLLVNIDFDRSINGGVQHVRLRIAKSAPRPFVSRVLATSTDDAPLRSAPRQESLRLTIGAAMVRGHRDNSRLSILSK
jgi:hypothetical protein